MFHWRMYWCWLCTVWWYSVLYWGRDMLGLSQAGQRQQNLLQQGHFHILRPTSQSASYHYPNFWTDFVSMLFNQDASDQAFKSPHHNFVISVHCLHNDLYQREGRILSRLVSSQVGRRRFSREFPGKRFHAKDSNSVSTFLWLLKGSSDKKFLFL